MRQPVQPHLIQTVLVRLHSEVHRLVGVWCEVLFGHELWLVVADGAS